jgi:LysM repeat protein
VDRRLKRWAAPVAFLIAVTIGALIVRAGLEHGHHHAKAATATVTSSTRKSRGHRHRLQHVQTYTVESGDTLESIATKTRTSVAKLEHLNPHVDPTSLRVGEKIRVK